MCLIFLRVGLSFCPWFYRRLVLPLCRCIQPELLWPEPDLRFLRRIHPAVLWPTPSDFRYPPCIIRLRNHNTDGWMVLVRRKILSFIGHTERRNQFRPTCSIYMYKQYCRRALDRTSAQPQVKLILLPSDHFSNNKHEIQTEPFFCLTFRDFWAVFRIRDIMEWIRIRGSMPLTNGSGSCFFRHWPLRCQQKTNFC